MLSLCLQNKTDWSCNLWARGKSHLSMLSPVFHKYRKQSSGLSLCSKNVPEFCYWSCRLMHWSVIWSQWNPFVRDRRSSVSKIKWCSAVKLKCFSNFPWWFQPNHDVPEKHHDFTELAFSPGKNWNQHYCKSLLSQPGHVQKVPRDLRGVVMWRKQCPGSRIPPGLALAEVEQVHFLNFCIFWLICSVLYEPS